MDCSLKLSRWCSAAPLLQRLEQRRIWQDTPELALPNARLRYNPRSSIPHNQVSEAEMEFGFGFGTIAIIIVILYVLSSIKILAEYERGVIFRLGRLLEQAKGPGVILVFTPFDRMVRVSLRQEALEVPPQDIITRDNVTLKVNAVIFLRVIEPRKALQDYSRGRRVLGGAAAGGRREIAGHRTGQRAVALSANFDGDRCGKEHDGSVSGSGGLFLWNAEDVWTAGRKRLTGCEQGLRAFVATTRLGYGELRRYRNHTGHGKNAGYIFRPCGAVRCFFRDGIFAGQKLGSAKRRGSDIG